MKFFNHSKFIKFSSIFFFIILFTSSTSASSSTSIPRTSLIASVGSSLTLISSNLANGWSMFINGLLDLPIFKQTPPPAPTVITPSIQTPPVPLSGEAKPTPITPTPVTTTIIQQISQAGLTGSQGKTGPQGSKGDKGAPGGGTL